MNKQNVSISSKDFRFWRASIDSCKACGRYWRSGRLYLSGIRRVILPRGVVSVRGSMMVRASGACACQFAMRIPRRVPKGFGVAHLIL